MSEAINYKITFDEIAQHLITVECKISRPNPAGQIVSLPAWLPGSYMIRDFAKHVIAIAATSNGKDVPLVKISKNAWQCAACTGALVIKYQCYGLDSSPRGVYVDDQRVFFDGSRVFLVVEGEEEQTRSVEIVRPKFAKQLQWRCATSMTTVQTDKEGFGSYVAANHLELIDHPFEISNFQQIDFTVSKVKHSLVLTGADTCVDLPKLAADITQICQSHVAYFGELPPMQRYVFITHAYATGYGGIEHRASCSLSCMRADLPSIGEIPAEDGKLREEYRQFLGLVSHEYLHLWNVKRIKPEVFINPDLYNEVYTRQLWIFEGITAYLDNLALVRSGLISTEEYMQILEKDITRLQQNPGSYIQTLEEASFDAWIKFYKPDENSNNSTVSYYLKGSLVALALDLLIIRNTRCKQSLADIMEVLWQQYGTTGLGLPEGYFERVVFEVIGEDYSEFFARALRSTEPLPLPELLLEVGVIFKNTASTMLDSCGWNLYADQNKLYVRSIATASVAEVAGIAPFDSIVAINNNGVNLTNVESILKRYVADKDVNVHIFRDEILRNVTMTMPILDTNVCKLELVKDTNAQQELQRNKWLT